MYVIIITVGAFLAYTGIMLLALYQIVRRDREKLNVQLEVLNVVKELKQTINQEEKSMKKDGIESILMEQEEFTCYLTLTDLITRKPEKRHYEEVVELLIELFKEAYANYNYTIHKSPDDTKIAHFLSIQSHFSQNPKLHKKLFKEAVDNNLDMQELNEHFVKAVVEGRVINLGDNVEIILEDGVQGGYATGVSPINTGLGSAEIVFNISCVSKDSYEEWRSFNFPEESEKEEGETE